MSITEIQGVPGAHPVVELGVGGLYDPIGGGLWNTATWNSPTATWWGGHPSWVDISCFVLDIETFIGRDRASDTFETGTATITVDNKTGWADSMVLVPSDPDPSLNVIPGREIRVGMQIDPNPTPYWLWRGVLDITTPQYNPEDGETVVFECIDAKGDAGRAEIAKITAGVGQDELPHQRTARILNAIKWPSWRRDLSVASSVALNATKLGKRAVELLDDVADSSGGVVFGDIEGRVVFRPMDWQVSTLPPDPDAIISNVGVDSIDAMALVENPPGSGLLVIPPGFVESPDGSSLFALTDPTLAVEEQPPGSGLFVFGGSNPAICPSEWEISYARADFPNQVIMGRDGEDPKTYELPAGPGVPGSATSQRLLGIETYSRTGLDTKLDVEIATLANNILRTRSHHLAPRVSAVTIDAGADDDAPYVLATASPFKPSRFACNHVAENGRVVFDRMMLLVGVEHTIGPSGWTCRLALDDARPYDKAAAGRWGSGHWQESVWATI